MNNVLITGVSGFIGSRLALRLRAEGKNVVGLVTNLHGKGVQEELFDAGCIMEFGSITDHDKIRGILSAHEIDTVYHLAAYAIVRLSARDPMSTYDVNVMGTVKLLEACRSYGSVKKIVVASSDKAYGDHDVLPYTEEHPLQPLNTYDTSKACMDMISRSYAHNYDMPVVVTRCSNVYGPGDRNWSRIIPNTIRRALNNQPPMFYSDVEKMVREFIYIDDVIEAYLCLGNSEDNANGRAFNVGGTHPIEIQEIAAVILSLMGRQDLCPISQLREKNFQEIREQYINADKLTTLCGWQPRVSLAAGIAETIAWIKENS